MARNKIQCHYCGKYRAESSNYSNLCDVCAKKLAAGMIDPDDIDSRWELIKKLDYEKPTRPAEADQTPEPEPAPASTQHEEYYQHFDDDEPDEPEPETFPVEAEQAPEPEPATASQQTPEEPDEVTKYYCDVCGAELKRGAYRCPKCDVVNDWRNTDLVDDPDVVICDTCGAITDGKRCHNCGGGGY